MENLKINETYLIKYLFNDMIIDITVLNISEKAYLFKWNEKTSNNISWILKNDFNDQYVLIENITNIVNDHIDIKKSNLIPCYVCHGYGTVPDTKSTTGKKSCPLCLGNKMIPETITI